MASSRSATWKAIASRAARARWPAVVPRVIPTSAPRAYGSQCGAPRPANAGTRNRPPLSGTVAASASVSLGGLDEPQAVAEPLHDRAADEDAAFERVLQPAVRASRRPWSGAGCARRPARRPCSAAGSTRCRRCSSPFRRRCSAGRRAPPADRRRCRRWAGPAARGWSTPRRRPRSRRGPREACCAGRRSTRSSSSSQSPVRMLNSSVREALLGIRDVQPAAGQAVQQPGVHGPEAELPGLGAGPRARHVVEDPADLRGREVRVQDEAGALADHVLHALGAQAVAEAGGAPVLPDDGVGHGPAVLAVPHDRGLALVGDADRRHVPRPQRGLPEGFDRGRDLARPDLLGIVLHPAGVREDLAELALRRRDRLAVAVEDDGARAGGSLVEGEYVVHGAEV